MLVVPGSDFSAHRDNARLLITIAALFRYVLSTVISDSIAFYPVAVT